MTRGRRSAVLIGAAVVLVLAALLVTRVAIANGGGASAGARAASATPTPSSSPTPTAPSATPSATTTAAPSASAPAVPSGDHQLSVVAGGISRDFTVYVPPGLSASARPALVLVFHGAGDTAADAEQQTGLDAAADTGHYLVAYLQGYQNTWNEGAGHTPAEMAGVDDVAFASAVIADVKRLHPIDSAHTTAVGFSNGALLVDLLGCRLAGVIHTIIPIEGQLPVSVASSCAPSSPISVLEVHGTADTTIPYGGGSFAGVGGGTTVLSARGAVGRWAQLDGCASSPKTVSGASVSLTSYRACRGGATVSLHTIVGGGHDWPNGLAALVSEALAG